MAEGINQPAGLETALSLHKGVDALDAPWLLSEGQAAYLENIEVDNAGLRFRRRGVESVNCVSGATDGAMFPQGMISYYDKVWNEDAILAAMGSKLYSIRGNGEYTTPASGATCVEGLIGFAEARHGTKVSRIVFNVDWPDSAYSAASLLTAFHDDRTWTQCASMAPRYASWWQRRLWCLDNVLDLNHDSLWWSELNDPLSYSSANTLQVEPGKGGRLTALVPIRADSNRAVVFKEKLIAMVETFWGTQSANIPAAADALDTITSGIYVITEKWGCVAAASIQPVAGSRFGDVIFLAHDGFRCLTRGDNDALASPSLPLSRNIQPYIDRINWKRVRVAVSGVWDRKYFCAVPTDDAPHNNLLLVFDLETGAWYFHTLTCRDLAEIRTGQDEKHYLYAQLNAPTTDTIASNQWGFHIFRTFVEGSYRDPNDASIVYKEDSRAFHFNRILNEKRWEWMALQGYANGATSPVDVFAKIDNDRFQYVGQLLFPEAGSVMIVLGEDDLPWEGRPVGLKSQKLSLSDLDPGFTLQIRLTQTSASDYSRPRFSLQAIAARTFDPTFDNEL